MKPERAELLDERLVEEYAAWARACYPREMCGVVVRTADGRKAFFRCENTAAGGDHFVLNPMDWAFAEDAGDVVAVVHSHPDASANPSMADRAMCAKSGLPWIVIGWPSGALRLCEPDEPRVPLLGREFAHGVLDCYALVRDYYAAIGIDIPDFERRDRWWEVPGTELYLRNFANAGFVEVHDGPRLHDGILMQVLADQVNHAAVYIGDGAAFNALLAARGETPQAAIAGGQLIVHHLYGRLSARDVYGGYWQRHTRKIVRHRSLLDAPSAIRDPRSDHAA